MPPRYLHQWPDWPTLAWEEGALATRLGRVRRLQDRLLDRTQSLDFEVQQQFTLEILSSGVVRSSAIEGEFLNPRVVRSSVARQVGVSEGGVPSGDRHIEGRDLVDLDYTRYCEQTLTGGGSWPARRPLPHGLQGPRLHNPRRLAHGARTPSPPRTPGY